MRLLPLALLASILHAAAPAAAPRTPILVELFTSEGCSSCPPADALLARLAEQQPIAGAEIIVLGEHVDYWDSLGWHDRFSSPQYTARQRDYSRRFFLDSVYTPQMVVDGAAQFVGNDSQLAREALQKAVKAAKLSLTLSPPARDGARFSATVSLAAAPPAKDQHGDLYAALIDPMATTEVRRGENGGHTLHHVSVVRTLTRIGDIAGLANGSLPFTVSALPAPTPPPCGSSSSSNAPARAPSWGPSWKLRQLCGNDNATSKRDSALTPLVVIPEGIRCCPCPLLVKGIPVSSRPQAGPTYSQYFKQALLTPTANDKHYVAQVT